MAERKESVATSDGSMEVFVVYPEQGGGLYPVVVQLMDGIGMREELREHARRTASWGYYVLAPDLYYRFGFTGPLDFSVPEEREQVMTAIRELTRERAAADVEAALGLAARDPAAADGAIGLYGFCMGGKLTLEVAQALGARVAAGVSIHPGMLATDEPASPHRHLDNVSAELHFAIADHDANATPGQIAELERELRQHGVRYELEWHPGALHGFMMASRPELYDKVAAERVRERMEALFARTLG